MMFSAMLVLSALAINVRTRSDVRERLLVKLDEADGLLASLVETVPLASRWYDRLDPLAILADRDSGTEDAFRQEIVKLVLKGDLQDTIPYGLPDWLAVAFAEARSMDAKSRQRLEKGKGVAR
jgi:hypothetical protein